MTPLVATSRSQISPLWWQWNLETDSGRQRHCRLQSFQLCSREWFGVWFLFRYLCLCLQVQVQVQMQVLVLVLVLVMVLVLVLVPLLL